MQNCLYKAWQLSQDGTHSEESDLEMKSEIAEMAWRIHSDPNKRISKTVSKNVRAKKLLQQTIELSESVAPPFYKVPHCTECQFKYACYEKLKEKDCISLLAGMTPKVRLKYQAKGITTITQLSHLFRPRRRRSAPPVGKMLWELKAMAIREQKTFVIQSPEILRQPIAIYIDFEGLPEDDFYYLLDALIIQDGEPDQFFSYWCDTKVEQEQRFKELFDLLNSYPEVNVYHFGSYETKALKFAAKKWPQISTEYTEIEKRLVNLLGYLRTHVYPPIYSNGLKELGAFLGYNWMEPNADGYQSIQWRKSWEQTRKDHLKEILVQYNLDDCRALHLLCNWYQSLSSEPKEKVQQVSQMKKHTPYHLQNNADYGADFQSISKAAYFDYQRAKIYWRNDRKANTPASGKSAIQKRRPQKGLPHWQPTKANEIVIVPPLKECPHCGHKKLYQSKETKGAVKQTDLRFTASGIKRYVTEYRTGTAKCAKCAKKTRNKSLHIMQFGDTLFALIINYYVNYHISNEMISKIIQEHYGITIRPMYVVMRKNKWWISKWTSTAEYIRKIVFNSPILHIDETTIKLARGSGYVWVFATSHSVFYHYTPTREANFLQEWLKDYKGVVISDFFPGYDTLELKRQKCLIHLIRDLNDELYKNPFDLEYKPIVTGFSNLLKKIVTTIDRHGLQKEHFKPHIEDTESFRKTFIEKDYKSELALKCVKRLKKHWEQLWTFLDHDNVPWNNNNAEAAIKAFAQHRRGVKGQMHVRGLNEYLEMLTVAQTCRYRNISFLKFLQKKVGIWVNIDPKALPPHLPFEQARLFVHELKLQSEEQWHMYTSTEAFPGFIPHNPGEVYAKSGWIDWEDWLGTSFLTFNKARTFVRKLHLKDQKAYKKWLASATVHIPSNPEEVYKHTGWISWDNYLKN